MSGNHFEKADNPFSKDDNIIYKRRSTYSTKHFQKTVESFSKADQAIHFKKKCGRPPVLKRRPTQTIFKRRAYNSLKVVDPSSKDGQTILKRRYIHCQGTILKRRPNHFMKTALRAAKPPLAVKPFSKGGASRP